MPNPYRLSNPESTSSGPGAVSQTSSPFQQQGSLSWINLLELTFTSSVGFVTRLADAGLGPRAIILCEYLGSLFSWGSKGRTRYDNALDQVRFIPAFGYDLLYFGLGVNHIMRSFNQQDDVAKIGALCACLAEGYDVSIVASIMMEFTSTAVRDVDPTATMAGAPSLHDWKALVKSCSGIFSASQYARSAEHFMRFDGHSAVAGGTRFTPGRTGRHLGPGKRVYSRGLAKPAAIAEVLLGLCKLTKGELHQMTVIGRADAALIAAIVHWLLDISFVILDNDSQELLYTDCEEGREPQLKIMLMRGHSEGQPQEGKDLQSTQKIYRLDDATEFIKATFESPGTAMLAARVRWKEALNMAFPKDFQRLLKSQHFPKAIGYAARMYEAVVSAEAHVPEEWMEYCRTYFPQSYGKGYVFFAKQRFPELAPIYGEMMDAVAIPTFEKAFEQYETAIEAMVTICNCRDCVGRHEGVNRKNICCYVALTETIIRTIRYLGGIDVDLDPNVAGLQIMYNEHIQRMRSFEMGRKTWKKEWGKKVLTSRIMEHVFPDDGEPILLAIAEIIFSGGRYTNRANDKFSKPRIVESQHISAIESQGLVYYLSIFEDPTCDLCRLAQVKVIRGRIFWRDRPFSVLWDGPGYKPRPNAQEIRCNTKILVPPTALKEAQNSQGGSLQILVQENASAMTADTLLVEYGVVINKHIICRFGPTKATEDIRRFMGLVPCGADHCTRSARVASCFAAMKSDSAPTRAFDELQVSSTKVYVTRPELIVALVMASGVWQAIVQTNECLPCCALAGIRKDWNDFVIIRASNSNSWLIDSSSRQQRNAILDSGTDEGGRMLQEEEEGEGGEGEGEDAEDGEGNSSCNSSND